MHGDGMDNVTFHGDFTPQERAILAAQFGRCRLVLVARSVVDPRVVLLQWLPALPVTHQMHSLLPGPMGALAGRHFYVLDARTEPPQVVPVATTAELHRRYPGHFPGVRLAPWPAEWLSSAWVRLTRPSPAHLLVVALVWLLALAVYMGWVTPRC
jgi:hypothetical protein